MDNKQTITKTNRYIKHRTIIKRSYNKIIKIINRFNYFRRYKKQIRSNKIS